MTENELKLLHRYLDGAISVEEMDLLETLLRNNKEARRTLRSLATIDAKWQDLAAERPTGVIVPMKVEGKNRRWSVGAVAAVACLAIIAMGALFKSIQQGTVVDSTGYSPAPNRVQSGTRQGTVDIKTVARVIRVEGSGLADQRKLHNGMELLAGDQITMQEGLIEMAFRDTGVHVIATAPLSLTTNSTGRLFLHDGEVKLVVPPQGIGFVVETGDRKITDLGTSFVVTARKEGAKVLVLDGQIAVAENDGSPERLMAEGELASYDQNGKISHRSRQPSGVPELSLPSLSPAEDALTGIILGFAEVADSPARDWDSIGRRVLPLIESGFQDRSVLAGLEKGDSLRFSGIAGTYNQFPNRIGLTSYDRRSGWLAWYHGRVAPPQPGRYRFWGYADNHLLLALNGKPVFEGSRYDSTFRDELKVERTNHPSLPCLNAAAGFASGAWIELDGSPVQLDILLGEITGNMTSGLLLVEREGDTYEESFWGQPGWPLFLTEVPTDHAMAELSHLQQYMEEKLMGTFSISADAIWKSAPSTK